MAQEDLVSRVMPHSLEAERSVLGAMLIDPEAVEVAAEIVREEDFYSRQNGVLFQTMLEMNQKGTAIDPVTLQTRLREKNLPPELYADELIRELIAIVPSSANIKSYANIVAEKSLLRSMIRANEEIAGNCYAQNEEMETLLDKAERRIFEISQRRTANNFVPIRQIVLNAMDKIEAASRIKGSVTGLSTGFTDLDNRTAGLQPADFILIAARPSMGKTALVLNIAEYLTMKEERCVAIFSLEMSKEQLVNRLFAMQSHVEAQKIRTGDLNETEWAELIESAGRIGESRLIIDDTPAISVAEMRSKCRKYKLEFGLDIIIIDYLQLMSGSGRSGDSRQQEISDISRSLKALARELNVPVVALSQLSRAVESRPNHRPMLSDLRESGAIEQDADLVMFIYRDDYYNEDSEKKGIAEIIIAKQRNGPIGTVELSWQPQLTKFANLARSQ
ncbi:MAG: replicative DNA helicase [Lachnospiraceae bacterium]|nr:replicative DNA helicase [Sarcina sp.]MBQ6590638.1 replicative DNA helicase [Lachnospiraceae bacterium]